MFYIFDYICRYEMLINTIKSIESKQYHQDIFNVMYLEKLKDTETSNDYYQEQNGTSFYDKLKINTYFHIDTKSLIEFVNDYLIWRSNFKSQLLKKVNLDGTLSTQTIKDYLIESLNKWFIISAESKVSCKISSSEISYRCMRNLKKYLIDDVITYLHNKNIENITLIK